MAWNHSTPNPEKEKKPAKKYTGSTPKTTGEGTVPIVLDGGSEGVFDCAPYFSQSYWKKLNDPMFFRSVYVEYGHLTWPGDIDISPIEVWQDAKRVNVV